MVPDQSMACELAPSAWDTDPMSTTGADTLVEGDENRGYSLSRVLALSDGVFAIAATLLVINVQLGSAVTHATFGPALRALRTEVFAYALSVVVIAAFWMGHRRSFAHIEVVDQGLLWLNSLYLGVIALIPFPTELIGRFGDETASVVIYALVISVAACAAWCLFLYARWRRLLRPTTPARFGADVAARSLSVSAAFAASIPVAFVSPKAAQYVWIAAVPVRVVWLRWARRSGPSGSRERPRPEE